MAFSTNPEGNRPLPHRNREVRQALMDALAATNEANRAIVEALLTDSGETCNTIIRRAYTQLSYSANNLRKAETCLHVPPQLQYLVDRRRR